MRVIFLRECPGSDGRQARRDQDILVSVNYLDDNGTYLILWEAIPS
jgi:hypothetical protein